MSIQLLAIRKCASASLSGLPANSGLKCNEFNYGIRTGCIGCIRGTLGCTGSIIGSVAGIGSCTGGAGGTDGDG